MYDLKLFGSPLLECNGAQLTGRATHRHRLALLALLALAPGQRLSRDKLLAYLWPEAEAERGRNLLNVASYVLRNALGEDTLLSVGDDLMLNGDVVRADVVQFATALERADFEQVVTLYRGPLLDGFFLSDAPEFEQWVERERERLANGYRKALAALAEAAEEQKDFAKATEWWQARAAHDPSDSSVALRLMQALDASGNRAGALQHAAVHQQLLQQEFGLESSAEIAALAEHLRAQPVPKPFALKQRHTTSPEIERAAVTTRRNARVVPLALVAVVVAATAFWVWPRAADPEQSIVVLPFENLSADPDNEYFSDGLTEEIITRLSAVPAFKVISRTSAVHYKGSKKPLREIARELSVSHVLEGSVRQSDGRVRISAQLIDARRDEHLWAQNYDYKLADIFQLQEEIAWAVARALELELGSQGRSLLARQSTRDPQAYQLYRRGRYLWNTRTRAAHEQALEYYQQAIARDSQYADAYAGIADAYLTAYNLNLSWIPEAETYSRVKWAAERALALDDRSADAHASFAVALWWGRNWPGAERELRRAIELNPGYATAHSWYALLLGGMGRLEEALEESRRAYELDPFGVIASINYAWHAYLNRDYDRALEQYQKTLEVFPAWPFAHAGLARPYAQKGMLEEALRAVRKAVELRPQHTDFLAELADVQARIGDREGALENLKRAKQAPFEPFHIARAYVSLGEPDSAFAWLERSNWQWPHRAVRADPALDPLRSDPRFARLSARVDREMGVR